MFLIEKEITEQYILDIYEYKTEYLKLIHSIITDTVKDVTIDDCVELARMFGYAYLELKHLLTHQNKAEIIWAVYEFLDQECSSALGTYSKPLSDSTKKKIEEWNDVTSYIRLRCRAIQAIENVF